MKKVIVLVCSVIILASCNNSDEKFEWSKDRVGVLTKEHMVAQLDSLYSNDSIVRPTAQSEYESASGIIEIYEKGGAHLLTLTPYTPDDPSSKIEYVQIRDGRFKTEKGITFNSTFKEISAAYKISSVDLLIEDAQVRVDEQSFYFTINQSNLPESIRFDPSITLDKNMIPDNATPEYVFVSW